MPNVNPLFTPKLKVSPDNKYIEVIGHFINPIECAKMTFLCEKYNAIELRDGYAKLPFSQEFIDDLKYINTKQHFNMFYSTASDIIEDMTKKWLRQQYPYLSETQITALMDEYGDKPFDLFDPSTWGDESDIEGLKRMLQDIEDAYAELGYMPETLTDSQIQEIEDNARAEIDAETRQILDLHDQTLDRTTDALQQNLRENNAMFSDLRNQMLTNENLAQQSIAGSTRYELDRQQRNAITRGASAAQRLVSNINTQLGLQAQSAQQSLDTSNALAQQLLAQRQAQAGIRQDYTSALNQYDANKASTLAGQAERRQSYAQGKVGWAMDRNQYARDAWNERLGNYFQGNSLGEGIYRSRYGTGRNKNNSL